jgi:diacylglycerol O-acyltransferase
MLALEGVKLTKNAISLPFVADGNTPLTGQVTAGRQFATASVSMVRVKEVCARTRSTLNHVALTCLDGALHRYLHDEGVELKKADHHSDAGQPAQGRGPRHRQQDRHHPGRIVAPTDDPYVRLRNIGFSLRNVRSMIDSVAPDAIESYTLITGVVAQLAEMLRLSKRLPPIGNTLVSNIPGPPSFMYLKGARMEELHPISTLPAGNLLNITLFSYAGQLFFGLIASDELPNLERLGQLRWRSIQRTRTSGFRRPSNAFLSGRYLTARPAAAPKQRRVFAAFDSLAQEIRAKKKTGHCTRSKARLSPCCGARFGPHHALATAQ